MTVAEAKDIELTFDRFDLDAYELFLKAKTLPEKSIEFDWHNDTYRITTPARFASLIDQTAEPVKDPATQLSDHLYDYQRWIVGKALEARRFAVWADTGLGKTAMFLEWARQLAAEPDSSVLILSPKQVIDQTVEEHAGFYPEADPLQRLYTAQELADWCGTPGIAITNTEKFGRGQVPQLKALTGLVLDESSILKTGGGSIKWNLIKSARGIPFKLSCTATPAPNDTMEYASQASFLECLRNEGEILWTYFTRDKKGNWRVKPHAREALYRFMAGWSIYMRNPATYGFEPILDTLPEPVFHEHEIDMTAEQQAASQEMLTTAGRGLFDISYGVRERGKLAQIARGFMYQGTGKDRTVHRIASDKPALVAKLAMQEVKKGRPTLIWTNFDEEGEIILEHLDIDGAEVLHGKQSDKVRADRIHAFRHGGIDCLISKPQLIGYGLNFQRCRAMVFSGLDDSFERRYQAVRRAYRLGQTETVHVHLPVVRELEGMMLENVRGKEAQFEEDVAQAEQNYVRAVEVLR